MNRRSSRGRGNSGRPNPLQLGLAQVDHLLEAGQTDEGVELLGQLHMRYGNNPEILGRMLNIALDEDDVEGALMTAEPLARLRPNDPELALILAISQLQTHRVALAWRSFSAFARRWPDHPQAEQARAEAADLHELLAALWGELTLDSPLDPELLAQHEEIQDLLAAGELQRGRRLAEQLLRAQPGFHGVRNNLSLIYQNLGQLDRAIESARQVLAAAPNNYHALGNLTRFLVLSGQLDEAASIATRLKAVPTSSVEIAVKQAEALSFFGDDEGVLAAFDKVQKQKDRDDDPDQSALLHHLAAVASMRMGRELAARRRWQTALELNPDLDLAAHNLADFDVPVDERHAPWPYTINYWMQREIVEELLRELGGGRQRSEEQLTQGARRFLQRHPHLGALVPLLLERGDPAGREFALRLAGLAQTPELLAALATFAQSPHGPTAMRLQAAQFAQRAGVLPNGTVRFWQRGEWHDTLMFGMELSGEPTKSDLPPQITELQREAFMAQGEGNYTRAEQLLQQALAQAPSEPGLLNNLGALYGKTGRNAEAKAIITRLATEHPDYVFGRTNFVPYLIDEGKIDEAKALIEPLMRRSQMHLSEFGAVASAQVSIALAEGNLEAAESWLGMWEQAYPDHPHLEIFRNRLQQARRTGRKRRRMEL